MGETLDSNMAWDAKTIAIVVIWLVTAPVAVTFGNPPVWLIGPNVRPNAETLFLGYTGKKWDRDFGVVDGRCDRQALAEAAGRYAISGANTEARQMATLSGSVAGTATMMDEKDRVCMGYVLELAGLERGVAWTNSDGTRYRVTPLNGYAEKGMSCREFVTRVTTGSREETGRHKACTTGDGTWQVVG